MEKDEGKKEEFFAVAVPYTPYEAYEDVQAFRRCQQYLEEMPEGQMKKDLIRLVDMGFSTLCEMLDEHGIESVEQKVAFEGGDFNEWKGW